MSETKRLQAIYSSGLEIHNKEDDGLIESLRQQLAAQKLEWEKAYEIGVLCKQQLATTERDLKTAFDESWKTRAKVTELERLLAESQAREKKQRVSISGMMGAALHCHYQMVRDIGGDALALPFDSTALDAAIAKAKREVLLEAAHSAEESIDGSDVGDDDENRSLAFMAKHLRRMADKLKGGEQ